MRMAKEPRLVVVSNRLPVALEKNGDSQRLKPGSGGLVTALTPILKDRGGIWIGWLGTTETLSIRQLRTILGPASEECGFRLYPVLLSDEEAEQFYYGFANEVLWPLFHDLQTRCRFDPAYWRSYVAVNAKYARVVARHTQEDDLVWIHDYHLMGLSAALKEMGVKRRYAFFLHIPFPPPDLFLKLPWREQLLRMLLQNDLIAFQTLRDRRNFLGSLRVLDRRTAVSGRGPAIKVTSMGYAANVAHLPISIDFKGFSRQAKQPDVAAQAKQLKETYHCKHLIIGVDRLDYTKGIPERLNAFRLALKRYPELRGNTTLVQIVVPSRERVPAYGALKGEIDALVGQINGEFTQDGWVPVVYRYQSIPRDELVAHYRAADVALVTPLKDGMNLVCKEYCACQVEDPGVLILSEFAGAASQLGGGALLVNPYDVEGMADALCRALTMPLSQRRRRMRLLRRNITQEDIFWWVDNFLRTAAGKALHDFPESTLPPLFPRGRRIMRQQEAD